MGKLRDFLRALAADRAEQHQLGSDHRDEDAGSGRNAIHGDTWTTKAGKATVYHQCGLKRGHGGSCLCRYWYCTNPRRP